MIIITTVGTSLLTNLIKDEALERCNLEHSHRVNIREGTLKRANSDIDDAIKTITSKNPLDEIYKINLDASSEIKSICKIANGENAKVYLLTTDTYMSEYAANKIKEHLNTKGELDIENPIRIEGLNIDFPEDFEKKGFENIVGELEKIREKHQSEKIILNISGGYKALIPYMTIYAQIRNLPIKYIYENSDKLISIDKSPLEFDWNIIEDHYFALESFSNNQSISLEKFKDKLINSDKAIKCLKDINGIINIYEEEKIVKLTVFGGLYLKIYNEKYNSSNFNRANLHSKLIEYIVFEHYQKEISDKKFEGKIFHGYTLTDTNTNISYDIDVFIETPEDIIAIEVKPAGNIPIKNKGNNRDSFEYKISEGSFKYIIEKFADKKNVKLVYVCYGPYDIHQSIINQFKEILEKNNNEQIFELNHLKTPLDFKSRADWKINSNNKIYKIFPEELN